MSDLHLRKQLLVAESEVNRTRLVHDLTELKAEAQALTERAKSVAVITTTVTVIVSALATLRRGKSAEPPAQSSWLQSILKGASLASNLWQSFKRKSE